MFLKSERKKIMGFFCVKCLLRRFRQLLAGPFVIWGGLNIVDNQGMVNRVGDLVLSHPSCPTLCDSRDHSLPGSSVHGDSPSKNTGVGCHAPLQRIPPTQGSNPGLPHCRQILYPVSHKRSTGILESVAHPFSRGS